MMDLQDGDTIAVRIPGQYPIYTLMRVVESLGRGRFRVRGFEMPAQLESGSREVVVERFVNLRDLLPPSVDSDLRKGAYVIALQPQGARLGQLLEDHHMQTPALLLRDFGYFDFRAQQEVGQQFTQPPKAIFTVRSYCQAL